MGRRASIHQRIVRGCRLRRGNNGASDSRWHHFHQPGHLSKSPPAAGAVAGKSRAVVETLPLVAGCLCLSRIVRQSPLRARLAGSQCWGLSVSGEFRFAVGNLLVSIPPLPFARTIAFPGETKFNLMARARKLGLTQTTRWEHAHATHSAAHNTVRFSPLAVSNRNPRSVYTRQGTRASHAATPVSNPALGVLASTIAGRRRRIVR